MEMQAECPIEFALEQQHLRIETAGYIQRRREALKVSREKLSTLINCSEKALQDLENGLLFPSMPRIRIEALVMLGRLESRQEGRRKGDKPILRVVR